MLNKFKSFIPFNEESNSLERIKNLRDLKNLVAVKSIFSILDNQDKNNKLKFVGV